MSFLFRLNFTGLCAVSPDQGFESGEEVTEALVLLPNVLEPTPLEGDVLAPSHTPFLDFLMTDLDTEISSKPNFQYCLARRGGCQLRGLRSIEHCDLQVNPTLPGMMPRTFRPDVSPIGAEPRPANERSLQWMLEISKLFPPTHALPINVKPNLRLPLGDPRLVLDDLQRDVSARCWITEGDLQCQVRELSGEPYVPFEFEVGMTKETHYVPHTVTLEFPIVTEVEIRLTPFGPHGLPSSLTFKAEPGTEVEVNCRNTELEAHLDLRRREFQPVPDTGYAQDLDFSLYYQLLTSQPASKPAVPLVDSRLMGLTEGLGACRPTGAP